MRFAPALGNERDQKCQHHEWSGPQRTRRPSVVKAESVVSGLFSGSRWRCSASSRAAARIRASIMALTKRASRLLRGAAGTVLAAGFVLGGGAGNCRGGGGMNFFLVSWTSGGGGTVTTFFFLK